jgi:hypothetical protein
MAPKDILFRHWVETYGSEQHFFRHWVETYGSEQHFIPQLGRNIWLPTFFSATG